MILEPSEIFSHASDITGKIVLIGTVNEHEDTHITPISSHMPGVLIHAHALRTVLSQDYLKTLPQWVNWIIAGVLAFCIIWLSLYISVLIKGLILRIVQVLMLLCILPVSYHLFLYHGVIVEVSYLLLMVAFSLFAADIWIGCKNMPKIIRDKFMKKYLVVSVLGESIVKTGNRLIAPHNGMRLRPEDTITLNQGSQIEVEDTSSKVIYTFDIPGGFTLEERIAKAASTTPKMRASGSNQKVNAKQSVNSTENANIEYKTNEGIHSPTAD